MEENFNRFLDNLRLTQNQREDAKKKYEGVINCLARHFYNRGKNDGDQYLFGSYKTKTAIRPIEGGSDVDVLFKIDKDTYEKYKNNTSGLLQECRNALKGTYSTTEEIHAWGKVVLVKFCDGTHNVEVLPAVEQDDSKFCIPNTENGGSWNDFDPRLQIDSFQDSNETTNGLTRACSMMIKNWVRNTSTLEYKSFSIVEDVILFTNKIYPNGKGDENYDVIVRDFFHFWIKRISDNDNRKSYFQTALDRASKAVEYEKEGKHIEASEEWRKIFTPSLFPHSDKNEEKRDETKHFSTAARPWSI
jgi:hypothetical protein